MQVDQYDILSDADALIIIPPFTSLSWPIMGPHLLQACSKAKGHKVKVFYANLVLAATLGEELYRKINEQEFLGDAFFRGIAYDMMAFHKDKLLQNYFQRELIKCQIALKDLIKIQKTIEKWLHDITLEILKHHFKIIGCSTTLGNVTNSICLLKMIKTIDPAIITVLGGAFCYNELAQGVASLSDKIDYIFSGDGEKTFPEWLKAVLENRLPTKRIIIGEKCELEKNPVPDYTDYFEQLKRFLPQHNQEIMILYETSRGCWWGQKNPCTFCGLTGDYQYRYKSPEKVIKDLQYLTHQHSGYRVLMTDCVLSNKYFSSLIPKLPGELPGVKFFYQIKANLSLEQVMLLKKAGITRVQPGIESLSSGLLKKMNKGCLARQNIALLRNCKSLGIEVIWHFLYSVPNEMVEDYQQMLNLIPLINHFDPPTVISRILIVRYSEYVNHPDEYEIKNISPISVYHEILPEWADTDNFAYFYDADYQHFTEDNPIVDCVVQNVIKWKEKKTKKEIPKLKLVRLPGEKYLLIDSRGLLNPLTQDISEKQAMVILLDWPKDSVSSLNQEISWALKYQLMIEIDSWYVTLVTAEADLILEFKNKVGFNNYSLD